MTLTPRSVGTTIVTVRVGKGVEVVNFQIHEKLLRESKFFKNAFKGPWREPDENFVSLPDFDRYVFDTYKRWLYTDKLYTRPSPLGLTDELTSFTTRYRELSRYFIYSELTDLTHLAHLGHHLLDAGFMDALSYAVFQCAHDAQILNIPFPVSYGTPFFEATPKGSPIRALVVDLIAWTSDQAAIDALCSRNGAGDKNPDFIMALLHAVASRFMSPSPSVSPLASQVMDCKYHSFGDKEPLAPEKYIANPVLRSKLTEA
jgi:hypothetical protein